MRASIVIALSLVLGGTVACKKKEEPAKPAPAAPAAAAAPAPAPAPTPAPTPAAAPAAAGLGLSPEQAEKSVSLSESFAKVIVDNEKNCDKMAAHMEEYITANAATLKPLGEATKAMTPAQKQAFEEKFKDRLQPLKDKVIPALKGCAESAAVEAAMKKMPL